MVPWSRFLVFAVFMATGKGDLTIGTEFYFAFPCYSRTIPALVIANSNAHPAMVTIESSMSDFRTMERTVPGNSSIQVTLSDDDHVNLEIPVCDFNVVSKQGFRLQASVPVALYALQTPFGSSGPLINVNEFMILPANMLSSEYIGGINNRFYGIAIAKQDGTHMTVGNTQITLNRLDVFYSSAALHISANVAFAYILRLSPEQFPVSAVMALPKTHGSTRNFIAPSAVDNTQFNNNIQVFALESTAQVSINGQSNISVPVDQPYETTSFGSNGGTIFSSTPVQVLTWSIYIDYAFSADIFLSKPLNFGTNENLNDSSRRNPTLQIVVPLLSTGNILLDGHAIPALQYQRIPNSQYYYYRETVYIQERLHTISTKTEDDRYLVFAFNPGSQDFPPPSNYPTKYVVAMNLTTFY